MTYIDTYSDIERPGGLVVFYDPLTGNPEQMHGYSDGNTDLKAIMAMHKFEMTNDSGVTEARLFLFASSADNGDGVCQNDDWTRSNGYVMTIQAPEGNILSALKVYSGSPRCRFITQQGLAWSSVNSKMFLTVTRRDLTPTETTNKILSYVFELSLDAQSKITTIELQRSDQYDLTKSNVNAAALSVLIKTTDGTIANLGFIVKSDNQCMFRIVSVDPTQKHKYEWDLDTTLVPCQDSDFPVVDHVQTEN